MEDKQRLRQRASNRAEEDNLTESAAARPQVSNRWDGMTISSTSNHGSAALASNRDLTPNLQSVGPTNNSLITTKEQEKARYEQVFVKKLVAT